MEHTASVHPTPGARPKQAPCMHDNRLILRAAGSAIASLAATLLERVCLPVFRRPNADIQTVA